MSGNKKLDPDEEELYGGRIAAPAARQRFVDQEVRSDPGCSSDVDHNSDRRILPFYVHYSNKAL